MNVEGARALFRSYGEFLHQSGAHYGWDFDDFQNEVAELPRAFDDRNGEVLVAADAGCIAYRQSEEPGTCEIKRLFVAPAFRSQGLAEALIRCAIDRAGARGYEVACLDTEFGTMDAAYRTYLKLGFVEYDRKGRAVFLRRSISE